jgi:hypothetical protein
VAKGQSWKRQSCGGGTVLEKMVCRGQIVLGETVLWQRDILGKEGLVVEGWSWKSWSCKGWIVLGKTFLWRRDGLGKDSLVVEGRSWKKDSLVGDG